MSVKTLIQEAINKNALGFEETLKEELRVRVAEAISAKMEAADLEEEIKDGDKVSWHDPDLGKNVTGVVTMASGMKRKGIKHAQVRIDNSHGTTTKVPHSQLKKIDEEAAGMVKDGYYVTNQKDGNITHDKPFQDSRYAISHANRGEDKTGYVHRVHKVKNGKIDKQWEYNGGHMEGGWEHFSDFKGDDARSHMRNIPKHFLHGND